MSELAKFASKSPIMLIKIKYKDEIFKFNLDEEMKIDEGHINRKIKTHIRGHAFLNILAVKLKVQYKKEQKVLARMTSSFMVKYKPKYKTVTEAEAVMHAEHPEVGIKEDELLALEEFKDLIDACLKSFESRKDLIQSLSANVRKETHN